MSPAGNLLRSLAWCCLVPGLTSCINPVGPKYRKPDATDITPAQWSWQPANPRDEAPKGEWWKIFQDDELDRLQERALTASPNVQAAVARVEQARANARATVADFFPDIRFKPSFKREQTSGHLPSPIPVPIPSAHISSFSVPLDLNYEIDFWGKLRRSTESARATAVATVADYHNVLLTLTADVTMQYFALRALDSELAVLRRTIELRETSLKLMDQRFNAGAISETDHARARSELSNARAELADAKLRRQEIAATLALLCGDPAGLTSFAERPLGSATPVSVPAGLPADLLERRPDIAAAERLVAARNADIGVATAGYFPSVRLTGLAGYLSRDAESLFAADSRTWSIGPSVSLPLSGYGLIAARVRQAKATREEAVARYRQAVLSALKDVETSLAQIRYRAEQATALAESLAAATKAAELTRQRYERGVVSYLELLDADRTRMQVELRHVQVKAQQHIASVRLIKALGGGWQENDAPTRSDRSSPAPAR
jgi:outer membrane protein, multidrug efflux system